MSASAKHVMSHASARQSSIHPSYTSNSSTIAAQPTSIDHWAVLLPSEAERERVHQVPERNPCSVSIIWKKRSGTRMSETETPWKQCREEGQEFIKLLDM
jgi:hypothetical protein